MPALLQKKKESNTVKNNCLGESKKKKRMKKKKIGNALLPEYDFSKGTRGKYAKRFAAGNNIIVLAPDVVKLFPNSESVNETLRAVAKIAIRSSYKLPHKPKPLKVHEN